MGARGSILSRNPRNPRIPISNPQNPPEPPHELSKREENYLNELPSGCEKTLLLFLKEPNQQFNKEKWNICEQELLSEGYFEDEELKLRVEESQADNYDKIKKILENHVQILKIRLIKEILKDHERGILSVKDKDIVLFLVKQVLENLQQFYI